MYFFKLLHEWLPCFYLCSFRVCSHIAELVMDLPQIFLFSKLSQNLQPNSLLQCVYVSLKKHLDGFCIGFPRDAYLP